MTYTAIVTLCFACTKRIWPKRTINFSMQMSACLWSAKQTQNFMKPRISVFALCALSSMCFAPRLLTSFSFPRSFPRRMNPLIIPLHLHLYLHPLLFPPLNLRSLLLIPAAMARSAQMVTLPMSTSGTRRATGSTDLHVPISRMRITKEFSSPETRQSPQGTTRAGIAIHRFPPERFPVPALIL